MRNIALLLALFLLLCPVMLAQPQQGQTQTAPSAITEVQRKNLQEYIELLRSDVRQQKAEIMGAMMALNIAESAKFWPIYNEYDGELTKLNNQRLADIKEYAANYDSISDARADELIQNAFAYRKQRTELLAKYYGRMKDALGAVQAARFLQVEDQLLEIIDLQIASYLPLAGQTS